MTKVATANNNFSRGKLDRDLQGRTNLAIYQSGCRILKNYITNFKGVAMNRTGMFKETAFQDCVFVVFDFSISQNYLCLFYENKVKFLTYDSNGVFGFVQSGGGDLEVVSPYTLDQARTMQLDQNADVMKMVHPDVLPQDFIRTSATSFTFSNSVTTGIAWGGDYPNAVRFKDGRLLYARNTTVWFSEAGDYTEFTIPGTITADSPLEVTLAELKQAIDWIENGTTGVILGNSQAIANIDGGSVGAGITADNVRATVTKAEGSNTTNPVTKDGLVFYISKNNRGFYFFRYDLLGENFLSEDVNYLSYEITRGNIKNLQYKRDRDDLIYTITEDGKLLSFNFKEQEQVAGWHIHDTEGFVRDIAVMPDNKGVPHLFLLVERNSLFYVERLADYVEFSSRDDFFTGDSDEDMDNDTEAYKRVMAEELKSCIYLDNSDTYSDPKTSTITYVGDIDAGSEGTITSSAAVFVSGDVGKHIVYKTITGYEKGRYKIIAFTSTTVVDVEVLIEPTTDVYANWYLTFDSVTGLSRFNGQSVGVLGDGAYLGEITVTGGVLEVGRQISSIVVGLGYTSILKSFPLGFQANGQNTNSNKKNIISARLRLTTSLGGEIGDSIYDLDPISLGSQNPINYLPEIPQDGTSQKVIFNGNSTVDKAYYVVQRTPLPLNICNVMIEASYEVSR